MTLSASAIWFIAGCALIAVEVVVVPGIGFLFAGLGAVTTGAILIFAPYLSPVTQTTLFFVSSAAWALALWGPMKRMTQKGSEGYNDMVGSVAVAGPDGLSQEKSGSVTWSGAAMTARIASSSGVDTIEPGAEVVIIDVVAGVLEVKPKSE